jgi:signal transduction histidine kinase
VLNLARIEAGSVTYDIRPIALSELVDAVVPMVEPQLAERELRLALQLEPGVQALMDRDKAEQILLNLLGNAVKFTKAGGSVRIVSGSATTSKHVWIEVEDTGVGIPADRLGLVFEPFVQVESDSTHRTEGTGLGLAISRDLARGMGAELTVTSALGEGSTFRLTLARA